MPNYCYAEIRVVGNARCVDEFTKILDADYSYTTGEFSHTPHFFRVFEAYITNEEVFGLMKRTTYQIECAWSVYCCMMDGPMSYYAENKQDFPKQYGVFYGTYLQECARRLGLFIEIFSEEEGMGFNEYYVIDNHGYDVRNEEYSTRSYDLNDYESREDFMNKTGDYIDEDDYNEHMSDNWEGYYSVNGYEPEWIIDRLQNPIKVVAIKRRK